MIMLRAHRLLSRSSSSQLVATTAVLNASLSLSQSSFKMSNNNHQSRKASFLRQVNSGIERSSTSPLFSDSFISRFLSMSSTHSNTVNPVNPSDVVIPRSLAGKTLFITGSSRGIGLAIALRAARDGANIAVVAKTTVPHPKLPGTIYSAKEEIEKAGGKAIAIACDIRDEESVQKAIDATVEAFGGIDILVNNASAINLTPTESIPMKTFDLMHSINSRGTFLCTKLCLPYLKKSENPHVLTLCPPVYNLDPIWFEKHPAYSMAKYGMGLCVLGHSAEFKEHGIAVNGLWPRTTIATAALGVLPGGDEVVKRSRSPEIMGDAAYFILTRRSATTTGNFFVDDDVLESEGITDLSEYRVDSTTPEDQLFPDFFVASKL
eukprot:m.61201 g.61201  ORF g.61201 m.61201 type:complete len:378 (+) comp7986_c0_seq1:128-1261(+)